MERGVADDITGDDTVVVGRRRQHRRIGIVYGAAGGRSGGGSHHVERRPRAELIGGPLDDPMAFIRRGIRPRQVCLCPVKNTDSNYSSGDLQETKNAAALV